MSGDAIRSVELFGAATWELVQAMPDIEAMLGRSITLVGGLAVLARLGSAAHRVTTDVDTVNRRTGDERGQIEVLLARGATAIDGAGVIISTKAGDIRVDTLEISADQLNDLPPDPTDRLYLLAHDWALRTATKLCIRAVDDIGRISEATVLVAEPGPLITTKLQALPNRTYQKEATDVVDIVRLTLDHHTGPVVREQLRLADGQIRADAAMHVERWFGERADRTERLVSSIPSGRDITTDTVALVGELLLGAMR